MLRIRQLVPLATSLALTVACKSSGGNSSPDADTTPPVDAGPGAKEPDAREPAEFDTLELRISPDAPLPEHEFSLYIRAADTEGGLYTDYEGVVSVVSSEGELLGATDSQPVTQGTAFLKLRFDESLEDITLTVTDDDDPDLTYTSEPFDVVFEGEPGEPGDVVINEVNWFGPLFDFGGFDDVWVELRNVSGRELNVSQWRLAGAGIEGEDVFLFSGSILPNDGYLVVGNSDIFDLLFFVVPGSLFGIPDAQLHSRVVPLDLPDEGKQLVLQDVEGTTIDEAPDLGPDGGWPAGLANPDLFFFESMERRDDITGGGYGDGSDPAQWYTWNRGGGPDSTSRESADVGTPGVANTDPEAAMSLPYATSFEVSEARFELLSGAGAQLLEPREGTEPRTGEQVLSTDSIRSGFNLRPLRSVDCIELDNDDGLLKVLLHAMIGTVVTDEAEPPSISLRHVVEWYTDADCESAHAVSESVQRPSTSLSIGEYSEVLFEDQPPSGATHFLLRVETRMDQGDGDEDAWAADDLFIEQGAAPASAP